MQDLINYFLNYPEALKKLKNKEACLIGFDVQETETIIKASFANCWRERHPGRSLLLIC